MHASKVADVHIILFVTYATPTPGRLCLNLRPEDLARIIAASDCKKWQAESARARTALRMPVDFRPWTSQPHITCGVANMRIADVIDISFTQVRAKHPDIVLDKLVSNFVVDVSRVCSRGTAVSKELLPPFKSNTLLYSFKDDAMYHPDVAMKLYGWPQELIVGKARDIQELGGTAKSVPSSTILAIALFLNPHAEWWNTTFA